MRIIFFGTPDFAVPSLTLLLESGAEVVAAVTQPDRPRTRSHSTLLPPPVKLRALAASIPVWQPESPRDPAFCDQVRSVRPDLAVVVAYGHLLRPALLEIPRLGFVNVHASLLPRWRGAAPIQWALLSGDVETGVAIMRVEPGLDTGAIWHQRETAISTTDTAGTLTERLSLLGAAALIEALPRVVAGDAPVAQGDAAATHAPKITREVARIRWDASPTDVSCRVRAMDPAPGAWTTFDGTEIKIFGARAGTRGHDTTDRPATILDADPAVVVFTGDRGAVEIGDVQPAGKRRMPAIEWLRGAHLPAGARFE